MTSNALVFGRYELERRLASGGMGEVFLARAVGAAGFEKRVALKLIFPQLSAQERYRKMFIREAKLTSGLSHPNIVQVLDLGEADGQLFIAMEYIGGADMSRVLESVASSGRRLEPDMVAVLLSDILEALHYAHTATNADGSSLRLIHRDISPQNVIVDRSSGIAKLCDFGVACANARYTTLTGRSVFGKLRYKAPEELADGVVDERTDLFSLSMVMFEALAGRHIFPSAGETVDAVKTGQFPSVTAVVPGVPPALAKLLDRALCFHPEGRFQSAADFLEHLDTYLGRESMRVPREGLRTLVADIVDSQELRDRELDERQTVVVVPTVSGFCTVPTDIDAKAHIRRCAPIPMEELDTDVESGVSPSPWEEAEELAEQTTVVFAPALNTGHALRTRRQFVVTLGLVALVIFLAAAAFEVAGTRQSADGSPPPEELTTTAQIQVPSVELAAAGDARQARALIQLPPVSVTPPPAAGEPVSSSAAAKSGTPSGARAASSPPRRRTLPPQRTARARSRAAAVGRAQPAGIGFLSLNARPWASVQIADNPSLTTPLIKHQLQAGKHRIRLAGPNGMTKHVTVVVRHNQLTSISVNMSSDEEG